MGPPLQDAPERFVPSGEAPLPLFDDAIAIGLAVLVALGIMCAVELWIRHRSGGGS